MADLGDVAIQGSDVERNYERITEVALRIAERRSLMVAVGGDHAISYPLGRGMELRELGARWATTRDVITRDAGELVGELVPESSALYVSFDLDVLDPSVVPGTTSPEAGGPSYRQVRELLVEVARRGRVIGFDVVELNPPYDIGTNTARVAGWVITHFLSEIFEQPR